MPENLSAAPFSPSGSWLSGRRSCLRRPRPHTAGLRFGHIAPRTLRDRFPHSYP